MDRRRVALLLAVVGLLVAVLGVILQLRGTSLPVHNGRVLESPQK